MVVVIKDGPCVVAGFFLNGHLYFIFCAVILLAIGFGVWSFFLAYAAVVESLSLNYLSTNCIIEYCICSKV